MSERPGEYCTVEGPGCPAEYSIYGYAPNLGLNAFFVAIFAALTLVNIPLGIKYKTWFFGGVMVLGCIGEAIGYGGRVMLSSNAFDEVGFTMQISCLIFTPAFFAAGIYLTLKHLVLTFGQAKSRIPAYLYTWIFITCDLISLLLQAAGGGIASSADDDVDMRDLGTNLMIAGIIWQVVTLVAFAALVIDYVVRTRRSWDQVPAQAQMLATKKSFKYFAWAVTVAFLAVFFRCVYRIAEMVGGWENEIMQDEASFAVMEGAMILIAVLALTIFHPGYCFPQLAMRNKNGDANELDEEKGVDDSPTPMFEEVPYVSK